MNKKALITGGLGFIGSHLARKLLSKGIDVIILTRSKKRISNIYDIKDKLKIIEKDLLDINMEVEDMDYVFHCASTVDNYNIHTDPYLDININCKGTIALLEACRKHNPKATIIYPSTFFVNGNLDTLPATPESPCNPLGLYPATKLAGEHFCKIYNQIFGLNCIIARFTNVFGEFEEGTNKKKAAFNYLIKLAVENKEIPIYGNGDFVRDYIHVENVVNALLIIAKKGAVNSIYYVGEGKGTKFKNLIQMVVNITKSGRIKYITPPDFHNKVGILNYYCDNTLLKKLGWNMTTTLQEGIKRTIDFYKNDRPS